MQSIFSHVCGLSSEPNTTQQSKERQLWRADNYYAQPKWLALKTLTSCIIYALSDQSANAQECCSSPHY